MTACRVTPWRSSSTTSRARFGLVASRIGEIGADVVDIDVIEHFRGQVRDEITVDLPSDATTEELAACLGELKGVVLEHLAPVGEFGHHLLVDALEVAAALVAERDSDGVLEALVTGVQAAFGVLGRRSRRRGAPRPRGGGRDAAVVGDRGRRWQRTPRQR